MSQELDKLVNEVFPNTKQGLLEFAKHFTQFMLGEHTPETSNLVQKLVAIGVTVVTEKMKERLDAIKDGPNDGKSNPRDANPVMGDATDLN